MAVGSGSCRKSNSTFSYFCANTCLSSPAPFPDWPVLIRGTTENDNTVFLDSLSEEFEILIGRGEVAKGLQMALTSMKVGERAVITCSPEYGYSDLRRPDGVSKEDSLRFDVELLRHEKEPNLHEMSFEEKMSFAGERREVGKTLFGKKMHASALVQYKKAILVLEDASKTASDEQIKVINEAFVIHLANAAL